MFNKEIILNAKFDAQDKYPQESCGIVVNDKYISCKNIAENPEQDFMIDLKDYQEHIMNKTLQAVIHSHPVDLLKKPSCPTKSDMKGQISTNVPWGIIDLDKDTVNDPYWWGSFLMDQPLIGQTFHHGINDCYSLIRKWYWQKKKIFLRDYARDDVWWAKDEDNMYLDLFEELGFKKISKDELQDGDVVAGKINSKKINHAGIYLNNPIDGNGLIIHHLYGRLSRRESASPYVNRSELFLRYNNAT